MHETAYVHEEADQFYLSDGPMSGMSCPLEPTHSLCDTPCGQALFIAVSAQGFICFSGHGANSVWDEGPKSRHWAKLVGILGSAISKQ